MQSNRSHTNWFPAPSNHDVLVIGTAQDAVKAKHAAVQAGYYDDPFIGPFAAAQPPRLVQVIIKRGTFARVATVQKAVTSFLNLVDQGDAQVVVLGAGKDTGFFRLLGSLPQGRAVHWFEVDHDQVFREKAATIEQYTNIFQASVARKSTNDGVYYELTSSSSGESWGRASCRWIAHDLKTEHAVLMNQKLIPVGLDPKVPTLVVFECVQMYISTESVDQLLNAISTVCSDCHICSYEPIVGSDSFGTMMEENLTKAGVVQRDSCLVKRRTLQAYLSSFKQAGWKRSVGCDMHTAFQTLLSEQERVKANRTEFLDELEEWMLIMRHYCFVVASNNPQSAVGQRFCSVGSNSPLGFVLGRCEEL